MKLSFTPSVLVLAILGCVSSQPADVGSEVPNRAEVRGSVVDAGGIVVPGAVLTIHRADAGCAILSAPLTVTTEPNGTFSATLAGESGPGYLGCVVVDASAGNVTMRKTSPVFFSSDESPRSRTTIDIALPKASVPLNSESERIVNLLRSAVNSMDRESVARLYPYVRGTAEMLWPAIDAHRRILGHIERVSYDGGDPRSSRWLLHGVGGTSLPVTVVTQNLTLIHSPVIDYAARADAAVRNLLSAAAANDVATMQRALTSDDEDVSPEMARSMIDEFRRRFDPSTVSATLVSVDSTRSLLYYRLSGLDSSGAPSQATVSFIYGDGLVGFRGF